MRFGHRRRGDGGLTLFAERDGRRLDVPGEVVLDDLMVDPESLARVLSEVDEAFDRGDGNLLDPAAALAPPLAAPGKVIAIGLNYYDHCREFGVEPPTAPVVFAKFPSSMCGHREEVRWDAEVTSQVDWEVELGVIIGRRARNLTEERALDAVFGYTVINDVTARDIQEAESQWVRAKSLDRFCPVGPVVVTADEVLDPHALVLRSRVNRNVMQESNTSLMIFGVPELVARLSASTTLEPGDVIATGTPLGVGAFRSPPLFLQDGDVMDMEIEGLGTLTNACRVEDGRTKGETA
jgi:2-keto-4-pentenoate hydratase/2-oxohepta-3-ene-1,7-dioic acid hydratase in catechol pathway